MPKLRFAIALGMLVVASGLVGKAIYDKEMLLAKGAEILLEIGPRDPRSLLQGDYMHLNYRVAGMPPSREVNGVPYKGAAVLKLDENRVARFDRFDGQATLAADELRIIYRRTRGWGDPLKLAPTSYFFEEGSAGKFESARYVIVRVGSDGSVLITGLANEKFEKIS